MILLTGGLGFIGAHTADALLDLGRPCLLTGRHTTRVPAFLTDRATVETLDITDRDAVLDLGRRHQITGIVHLAHAAIGSLGVVDEMRATLAGLLNVLEAATLWGVRRVSVASTIGVYLGVEESPFREASPLPFEVPAHPLPTVKKISELVSSVISDHTGTEVVNLRIAGAWGPLGRPESRFLALPGMVHSAVRGSELTGIKPGGGDLCYVKDIARGIALLQTADHLDHRTYNVGSGSLTTNHDIADAIRSVIPEAVLSFEETATPETPYLDITRLRQDTGYTPQWPLIRAIPDYLAWLRSGHPR